MSSLLQRFHTLFNKAPSLQEPTEPVPSSVVKFVEGLPITPAEQGTPNLTATTRLFGSQMQVLRASLRTPNAMRFSMTTKEFCQWAETVPTCSVVNAITIGEMLRKDQVRFIQDILSRQITVPTITEDGVTRPDNSGVIAEYHRRLTAMSSLKLVPIPNYAPRTPIDQLHPRGDYSWMDEAPRDFTWTPTSKPNSMARFFGRSPR